MPASRSDGDSFSKAITCAFMRPSFLAEMEGLTPRRSGAPVTPRARCEAPCIRRRLSRPSRAATPLDGNVQVRVDSWTGAPYSVVLRDPASGSVVAAGRGVTVTGCGGRMPRVDVARRGAPTAFDLTITKP